MVKRSRIKRREPKAKAKAAKGSTAKTEEESEKPHDFGGLPDRNLKKNLGC